MTFTINLKFLFVILIIVGAIIFIYLIKKLFQKIKYFFRRPNLYGLTLENVKIKWQEIEELGSRGDEMSSKLAIIEADKLLDHVLKSMMISGKDLGERLKLINYKYPETKKAWNGHRLRNQLVHVSHFNLTPKMVKEAMHSFKVALQALGVL
jgi:hypothetical protein